MIRNITYNDEDTSREIISLVGTPYSFLQRTKMGSVGSPRFIIMKASSSIERILSGIKSSYSCNIELRPAGIIISFNVLPYTFAWVIPYYKLGVDVDSGQYIFFTDVEFLRVKNYQEDKINAAFIQRILEYRDQYLSKAAKQN